MIADLAATVPALCDRFGRNLSINAKNRQKSTGIGTLCPFMTNNLAN
ncbi:MAG: hypothetical protein KME45_06275 [Stenomitos rutilans HA7619-LM2]|nr:hypothetical protein [Stenomitos rutilans HA7619-LM2]